jgi:hypothetical protein
VGGGAAADAAKMARHDNVYDAMLSGFMKLILVICIGVPAKRDQSGKWRQSRR